MRTYLCIFFQKKVLLEQITVHGKNCFVNILLRWLILTLLVKTQRILKGTFLSLVKTLSTFLINVHIKVKLL